MKRRTFLACGALASFASRAQAPPRSARIGFVEAGSPSANAHFLAAFRGGMRSLGYEEGRNLAIDARWAGGEADRFVPLLAEVARLRPDVIVVASTQGALAAKQVVKDIPLVFVGVSDPLGMGLVSSLAKPGGNMTGLSRLFAEGLIGKELQALKEIVPSVTRLAILWNAVGAVDPRVAEAEDAARALRMTTIAMPVARPRRPRWRVRRRSSGSAPTRSP
jgi:putative ABC transport system substrate-binding protein